MIGLSRRRIKLETDRLTLRLPQHSDFRAWSHLRQISRQHLAPWEPTWSPDHISRKAFTNRVYWAHRSARTGSALSLFLIRRSDAHLVGAVTLDNIRRGPAQSGTLGYWVGKPFVRHGFMHEAIMAVVQHAFGVLGLGRIEAACLPHNHASRRLIERCGFGLEGTARAYLQIDGRWQDHVMYAALRSDRAAVDQGARPASADAASIVMGESDQAWDLR